MKGKSGYGMKKSGTTKIAGGPSFQIRPADDDPSMSNEEWQSERLATKQFLRKTPEGQRMLQRAKQLQQRLKGV